MNLENYNCLCSLYLAALGRWLQQSNYRTTDYCSAHRTSLLMEPIKYGLLLRMWFWGFESFVADFEGMLWMRQGVEGRKQKLSLADRWILLRGLEPLPAAAYRRSAMWTGLSQVSLPLCSSFSELYDLKLIYRTTEHLGLQPESFDTLLLT